MTSIRTDGPPSRPVDGREDELAGVRHALLRRIVVATTLAVGLLAVLVLFDDERLFREEPETDYPRFTRPVPVAGKAAASTTPVVPAEPPAADAGAAALPEPSETSPAAPVQAVAPSTARPGSEAESASDRSPVPGTPAPSSEGGLSGHFLEAGAFTDPAGAEALKTRLAEAGLPATVATRVLIGPFKNRKDAGAARAKLRTMGIDAAPLSVNGKN